MVIWIVPSLGLLLTGYGIWQYRVTLDAASLDALWQQEERELLARGLSAQRSADWGYYLRRGAVALIVFGVFSMILGIFLATSVPNETSGVSNGGFEFMN